MDFLQKKKKMIFILAAIFITALFSLLVLYWQSPEYRAQKVLFNLFTCTPQDIVVLNSVLAQGEESSLLDYVHKKYPNLFTQNGSLQGLQSRIFSRSISVAANTANSFTVASIKMQKRQSTQGIFCFDYLVRAESQTSSDLSLKARGVIIMTKENNLWKAENVSIDMLEPNIVLLQTSSL